MVFCPLFLQAITNINSFNNTFDDLVKNSKNLNAKTPFPTQANRVAVIAGDDKNKQAEIGKQAGEVRPILHERVKQLIKDFIAYKEKHGSSIEQDFYKNMSESPFVDRLLTKRPLMFVSPTDNALLRNGMDGSGGFELIGTEKQEFPLLLKEYLSYDEMQIAALIGVSVPTYFINNGARNNAAKSGDSDTFEEKGIYTGLVGTRFEKPGLMEWQHMIVTPEQNTKENGYGAQADQNNPKTQLLKIWSQFYGNKFPTFQEAQADTSDRFHKISSENYLDTSIYKERLGVVLGPFLADANQRGKDENKMAYCRVVGLGLGVWAIDGPTQAKLMLEVYSEILEHNKLEQLSTLEFLYFPLRSEDKVVFETGHGGIRRARFNEVRIKFTQGNPADKLQGEDADKLLVTMYAWDGNAYPGNEYWAGMLTASGDPAAACCSTIAELQNPLINPTNFTQRLFWISSHTLLSLQKSYKQ